MESATVQNIGPALMEFAGGKLKVDPAKGTVEVLGVPHSLQRMDCELLAYLAAQGGKIKTRDEILDAVWGKDAFVELRIVDTHIRRVRKTLEGSSFRLKAIRRKGYALVATSPEENTLISCPGAAKEFAGGRVKLDFANQRITIDGKVHLLNSQRQCEFLDYLLSGARKIKSREQILCAVWRDISTKLRTVDVYVLRLRRAFAETALLFETHPGMGYSISLAPLEERRAA